MNSYEEILKRMTDKYEELSGNQVPPLSDIDIRLKVLAGEIYNNQVNLEYIKRQMFPKTAAGEYLDLHAADRSLSRKQAVKATGKVRFFLTVELEENLEIPKGTIVATSGSEVCRYLTDSDAVIAAGKKSITLSCTAEKGGVSSNVLVGAVNVLVTTIPGISKVSNTTDFTGGTDVEDDESLRKRILDSYVSVSNGTNKAYYRNLALSVAGVTDASVIPQARGTGTVDVYISSNKAEANSSLITTVQSLMETEREVNVDVLVSSAKPYSIELSFYLSVEDGYDYNSVAEKVETALKNYIASLSIGEHVLDTHLGKVILSIEGVYNYEWTSTYISSYIIGDGEFAVLGTLSILEATE